MNLFLETGRLCRETDAFLAEKQRTTSPLLKVQFFERGQAWTAKLTELQTRIASASKALELEVRNIDEAWGKTCGAGLPERGAVLRRLEEICRLLGFFGRWSGQLQERIVQLSF